MGRRRADAEPRPVPVAGSGPGFRDAPTAPPAERCSRTAGTALEVWLPRPTPRDGTAPEGAAGIWLGGRDGVRRCRVGELFNVSRSTVYRAVRRADRTADSDRRSRRR